MSIKTTSFRIAAGASVALIALAGLAACGGGSTATGSAAASTVAATTEEAKEPSYASWGIDNIPYCEDLDILYSDENYCEYLYYTQGVDDSGNDIIETRTVKTANTPDGYAYQTLDADGNVSSKAVYLNGKYVDAEYALGMYFEDSDSEDTSTDESEDSSEDDDFSAMYTFAGTGKSAIEMTNDATEYTYYEYTYTRTMYSEDGSKEQSQASRKYYVQDGKLIAEVGINSDYTTAAVYQVISKDIPDGFMTVPDVTGLEKQEW